MAEFHYLSTYWEMTESILSTKMFIFKNERMHISDCYLYYICKWTTINFFAKSKSDLLEEIVLFLLLYIAFSFNSHFVYFTTAS